MGHELSFWRYEPGERADPIGVYQALGKGNRLPGLASFPVDTFLADLARRWSRYELEDDEPEYCVYRISPTSIVEVSWSDQHVDVTLRPFDKDLANDVIEAAGTVDAPLFDPQVNERFDSYTRS